VALTAEAALYHLHTATVQVRPGQVLQGSRSGAEARRLPGVLGLRPLHLPSIRGSHQAPGRPVQRQAGPLLGGQAGPRGQPLSRYVMFSASVPLLYVPMHTLPRLTEAQRSASTRYKIP
jgi:hypothetical protein